MIHTIKNGKMIFAALLMAGTLLFFISCTSSVRYSSKAVITADKYIVSGKWDYRKNYKVPSTRLNSVIASYLGTPYRSGGMSHRGVDCSGFVCLVYKEINHAKLPHSTHKMHSYGERVSIENAIPGDLVFFKGGVLNMVNHVGIYVGDRHFAHASSSSGVIHSSLDDAYYKKHLVDIRRVF